MIMIMIIIMIMMIMIRIFKMDTWPKVRWTVVTGVDWAVGGKWVEVAILECVGVEVRLPAMSNDMFGLRRNWKFKWLITRAANLMRLGRGVVRLCDSRH